MTLRLLTITEAADQLGRSRDFIEGLIDDGGQPPVDRVATTPAPHAWRRTGHRRPAGVPHFSRLPAAGSSTTPAPPTTPN